MSHSLADYQAKDQHIGVIGLGYVGLPLALAFAKHFRVLGFDPDQEKIASYRNGQDPAKEVGPLDFQGRDILFTTEAQDLAEASFFIVAVPTPIDEHRKPDLRALISASKTVGKLLKPKDVVVYESTVYPGCTEEDCLPILEKHSDLKSGVDFKIGYSPERINPGDKEHTFEKIVKVTAGMDEESASLIDQVYATVVQAGTYRASSIRVAEAAKVIENTQRDLNIALMNELSLLFHRLGIDTQEVLRAAGTKWNFLPFRPGLVGGHCIGVDPYYLTYKATELGFHPQVILAGRKINDTMGREVAQRVIRHLMSKVDAESKRVLLLGISFKEDVSDIRNSKVVDIVKELRDYGVNLDVHDALADSKEVEAEYGFNLCEEASGAYQAVILAVCHREYVQNGESWLREHLAEGGLLFDVKGLWKKLLPEGAKYDSL